MVLFDSCNKVFKQPYGNFICAVVVVSVAREVAFNLKVRCKTGFRIADCGYFCIFDCGKRINYMAESCNSGCKCAAYIGIDERKLGSFVIIFVVHIVNEIKRIHVNVGKPVEIPVVMLHNFVVVKYIRSNRCIARTYLLPFYKSFVYAAVDGVKQGFCKICTRPEELHFFSRLSCGNTAAYRIVISPNRAHNIIVFILNRACFDGNICRIVAEVFRQTF